MKKAPLFITLGLFVLVGGGIFIYQYFFHKNPTAIWEMIPEQTVLVYEANECEGCSSSTYKPNVAQLLEALLLKTQRHDSLIKTLDFLFTPKKGKAISLHVISKDDLDAVYYFTGSQAAVFKALINQWKETRGLRFAERELNGFKIFEYTFNKKLFSVVQLGDAWAGSFTPFLIEDVVRTYESQEKKLFKNEISAVSALPYVKDDAGNIYIHLGNLTRLLKIFPANLSSEFIKLADSGLLDIKQGDNSITLNGFSLANKQNHSLLSFFDTQSPVQFNIKQYISNQTMVGINYGISDGAAFYEKLDLFKNRVVLDSLSELASLDYDKLFSSLGKELAVCFQESGETYSKIVVFETQKPSEWIKALDLLSEASSRDDTVFYERYSSYEIKEIDIHNFTGKLFSPLVSGSSRTYYSSIGNYILMAENVESLKGCLEDIDQENVWGKSVAFNKFIESTLLESNFSVYINTPLVWSSVTEQLGPRWKTFVQENQALLNSFDFGAIQFSHLNESFYTNLMLTYSDFADKTDGKKPKPSDRLVATLGAAIITSPTIVKSHVNGADEVLIQDSAYVLYHLSADGKVLWRKELHERIVGEIHQVDIFANGKLQFFFATQNHLHIIDRLGKYVNPYPQEIKIRDLEYVSVIDYDKSKKYRFLLADKSGKLWMFDKDVKNLEGWTPMNVASELIASPKHYRIRGKDYILSVRKDGYVYLTTRRGELIKGFPLNLEARPSGELYLESGNTVSSTNFTCVSRDGFRIKFNLEGKIMSRETLIKPSFETQFSLINEHTGKSYIILRQDTRKLTLLKPDGKEILSNAALGLNQVHINYYDFGAGKIYFTVTDLEQELSFIYDEQGNLLTPSPIEGRSIELRPTRDEMPKIFSVNERALLIQ